MAKNSQAREVCLRALRDSRFVGYWFQKWCETYNRRLRDVCAELMATEETAVSIMLCDAPLTGCVERHVWEISDRFQVDPRRLARLLFLCRPTRPKLEKGWNCS